MVINRAFRISAAVALAALAALVGATEGDVTSRHVVAADTTWAVPAGATADAAPADTTWAAPADTTAVDGATVQPADTTW